jgi:thiol-disulfide isomerase/thioredoxin/uncharacterized membrane protein YphA (DoxX/SURF4 family)
MDVVLLALRLALARVLAAAAVGKLLDLAGSRRAVADFGVPARVAPLAGTLLPLAELAVAVALIPAATAQWAAVGGVALLLAFIAGISRALRQGRAPDCHCFGQIHSAPAGRGALVRNAVLAAAAGVVVGRGPGPDFGPWASARSEAEVATAALSFAAAALALLSLRLWLDNRKLARDLEEARRSAGRPSSGLPVGSPAPDFTLPDPAGATGSLAALREGARPVALMFMAPGCGPCRSLLPDLKRWQVTLAESMTIAVISKQQKGDGAGDDFTEGLANVLLESGTDVSDTYRVRGTPSAVIVSPSGTIASETAAGAPAIEALIRVALARDLSQPVRVIPASA